MALSGPAGASSSSARRERCGLRSAPYFDERIIVENRSWIPKLWLEIEDQGQHPEHTASFVVSLGPYGRFVRRSTRSVGSAASSSLARCSSSRGDPFGIFRQRRQIDGASTLVVYPVALPLAGFGRVDGELTGRRPSGRAGPAHHDERLRHSRVPSRRHLQPYSLEEHGPAASVDGEGIRVGPVRRYLARAGSGCPDDGWQWRRVG